MLSASELSGMISDVFRLHSEFPKSPEKAFRKFDGRTPYGVHPTLAAMLFAHEESLYEDLRVLGIKALLGHDLIEDTTAPLPAWCSDPEVELYIRELTFTEGQNPLVDIWHRRHTAILLKFYDVVANLMCAGAMKPERAKERQMYADRMLAYIKDIYPQLEILKIARGLLRA
jgi:hypothetical protein